MAVEILLALNLPWTNTVKGHFAIVLHYKNANLVMVAAEIVERIICTSEKDVTDDFMKGFNHKFKFGTIVHGPCNHIFYSINTVQKEHYTFSINSDHKLKSLQRFLIFYLKRRDC